MNLLKYIASNFQGAPRLWTDHRRHFESTSERLAKHRGEHRTRRLARFRFDKADFIHSIYISTVGGRRFRISDHPALRPMLAKSGDWNDYKEPVATTVSGFASPRAIRRELARDFWSRRRRGEGEIG